MQECTIFDFNKHQLKEANSIHCMGVWSYTVYRADVLVILSIKYFYKVYSSAYEEGHIVFISCFIFWNKDFT